MSFKDVFRIFIGNKKKTKSWKKLIEEKTAPDGDGGKEKERLKDREKGLEKLKTLIDGKTKKYKYYNCRKEKEKKY